MPIRIDSYLNTSRSIEAMTFRADERRDEQRLGGDAARRRVLVVVLGALYPGGPGQLAQLAVERARRRAGGGHGRRERGGHGRRERGGHRRLLALRRQCTRHQQREPRVPHRKHLQQISTYIRYSY